MTSDARPTLFLAVPGTQDTRELDLDSVRSGVARGEIPLDNWAWSPKRNAWLPLSELPEFAVPAPVLPAPVRVAPKKIEPVKVAVRAAVPTARTATTGRTTHAATYYAKPIEEHHEFPIFKILFFVMGVVIAALVAVNYCLVDQPFRANMARTPFANVQTHAHLGAFVQPGVLLIHIFPSNQVNSDNFADLLIALTQSTPRQGIPGHEFQTISLTPGWLGQYAVPVGDWSGFAGMTGYSPEEKEQFVLSHLRLINGEPLLKQARNENPAQHEEREDQTWQELVSHFQSN